VDDDHVGIATSSAAQDDLHGSHRRHARAIACSATR
jgi:hypothetical protein